MRLAVPNLQNVVESEVAYDAGGSVEGREQAVMNEPAEEERDDVEDDGGLRQRRRLEMGDREVEGPRIGERVENEIARGYVNNSQIAAKPFDIL